MDFDDVNDINMKKIIIPKYPQNQFIIAIAIVTTDLKECMLGPREVVAPPVPLMVQRENTLFQLKQYQKLVLSKF